MMNVSPKYHTIFRVNLNTIGNWYISHHKRYWHSWPSCQQFKLANPPIYTSWSDLFWKISNYTLIQNSQKVSKKHWLQNMTVLFYVSLPCNTEGWQKSCYRILKTKKFHKVLAIFLFFFIICLWTQVSQISFPLIYIGELLP